MKILKRGKGYFLRFRCEECGSDLEAEKEEITLRRLGDDIYDYHCPVCETKRSIRYGKITKVFWG